MVGTRVLVTSDIAVGAALTFLDLALARRLDLRPERLLLGFVELVGCIMVFRYGPVERRGRTH